MPLFASTGFPQALDWRGIRLFNAYRMLLAGLLVIAAYTQRGPSAFGHLQPQLFADTAWLYLFMAVAFSLVLELRLLPFTPQIQIHTLTDTFVLVTLMHASGGPGSGLGLLLILSIALSSLLLQGRMALFHAAIAALALLVDTLLTDLSEAHAMTSYSVAGIAGFTLFAVAGLAHSLARRVHQTETLARQRVAELTQFTELTAHILERFDEGVLLIDEEQRLVHATPSARRQLALAATRAEDRRAIADLSPVLAEALMAWRAESPTSSESLLSLPEYPDLRVRVAPLSTDGKGAVVVLIEDTRVEEERIQQAKLAALGRLTASIAHEVRNPLASIHHAAQLLEEEPERPALDRKLLNIILDQSRRMNRLIENVLQISRRRRAQTAPIDLCTWLPDFIARQQRDQNLSEEQLVLSLHTVVPLGDEAAQLELDYPESLTVHADIDHLDQILAGLIDNARRHASLQERELRITLLTLRRADGTPCIVVEDNGPGVPVDAIEQLFEPFFTTRVGGTGLGLFLARELAESNGARLDFEPGQPVGSCFRLCFPGDRVAMRRAAMTR